MPDRELTLRAELEAIRLELVRHHAETQGRIDLLAGQVGRINGSIGDILLEIGDAPDMRFRDPKREPLRTRMHNAETGLKTVNQLSEALIGQLQTVAPAVQELREERSAMQADRRSHDKRLARFKTIMVTCCTVAVALGTVVGLVARFVGA